MEDTGRLFSKILPEDASFQTQVSLYKYALETGDFVLEENCLQYLAWNYQNLTMSPAWTHISIQLLGSLLLRSDLVVPDEYVLLQTVESWIEEKGNSTPLDTQHDLLSRIRSTLLSTVLIRICIRKTSWKHTSLICCSSAISSPTQSSAQKMIITRQGSTPLSPGAL